MDGFNKPKYDNIETVMAKCLAGYDHGPDLFPPDGILDPVPAGLAGSIDLSDRSIHPVYPHASPMGRTQRILFSERPTEFMKPEYVQPEYRSSAPMHLRHVQHMIATELCAKKHRSFKERGFARFFTVLKKINEDGIAILRTILDCITANLAFMVPDAVNLANLHAILEAFSNVAAMRTLDLRHMFHQVKVGEFLRSMFVVAFGALRLMWCVLPMGWTWACFCAQSITMFAVAGDVALTWTELPSFVKIGNVTVFVVYDNVLAGGPADELDVFWSGLLERLERIHAWVKEDSDVMARDGSSLDSLGLRWTPAETGLSWELLPKFLSKVEEAVKLQHQENFSAKDAAACVGLLSWGRYATKNDICDLHGSYRALTDIVVSQGWGGRGATKPFQHVFDSLAALKGMGRQTFTPRTDEVLVYSDAHINGYGFVGGYPIVHHSSYWGIGAVYESRDMFYLEAIAAKQAVITFAKAGRRIHLATDNKALMYALRKKSTSCPRTAVVLHELFEHLRKMDCSLVVGWIPTEMNPADELSRHEAPTREKLLAAESHIEWTDPRGPQFGSKLGRVVG